MKIYCLICEGNSLTEEICQLLSDTAQTILAKKGRRSRVKLASVELEGEITTDYKFGFIGTIGGIVFSANIDWRDGSARTSFLVRPRPTSDTPCVTKWVRTPLFPPRSPNLALN